MKDSAEDENKMYVLEENIFNHIYDKELEARVYRKVSKLNSVLKIQTIQLDYIAKIYSTLKIFKNYLYFAFAKCRQWCFYSY